MPGGDAKESKRAGQGVAGDVQAVAVENQEAPEKGNAALAEEG